MRTCLFDSRSVSDQWSMPAAEVHLLSCVDISLGWLMWLGHAIQGHWEDSFARQHSLLTSTALLWKKSGENQDSEQLCAYGQNYGMGNSQHIFFWCLLNPEWWLYNLLSKLGRFWEWKGSTINNNTRTTGVKLGLSLENWDVGFMLFLACHDLVHPLGHVSGGDVRQATEVPEEAKHSLTRAPLSWQVSSSSPRSQLKEACSRHTRPLLSSGRCSLGEWKYTPAPILPWLSLW